ncbi:MAG: S41 family peptidase [Planctomycetota bacterium]|nr:S41 family peptidase [Planctomycetota bacterium]
MYKAQNSKLKTQNCGMWLVLLVFLSAGSVFAAQPARQDVFAGDPCTSGNKVTKSTQAKPSPIERACELIYEGKFDAAGELIKQSGEDTQKRLPSLSGLEKIVEESKSISQRRQTARETAYREQLAELEKLRAKIDVNDVRDANDRNDVNDVNNITTALSVITKACEFADQTQKERLLSDAFVKRVLQKAIDKAAAFEVKGKWLEAYTSCYYWLQAIEPNNKAYWDYAEQLLDKASIAASFQDSPCETREQRYAGVEKEMFVRAIDALSMSYVSIIDYGQMATKAIERCKLLAEVMAVSYSQSPSGEPNKVASDSPLTTNNEQRTMNNEKLAAWSSALAALQDEVHQSPTGFDKDKFIGVFEKVLTLNTATVEMPAAALIAQFSEAALFALDPYTVMVWPRQVQDFEKMMTNEFTGIGIEISKEKGELTVASLLPDTPAYKSGLDAGDVIKAVDGVGTKDMTLVCAVRKITGPKGTKVTLTIRRAPAGGGSDQSGKDGLTGQTSLRPEEKTRDITLTRDKITVPTIRGWQRTEEGKWLYVIDERSKIGYVQVSSFSAQTASDLEEVLKRLEAPNGVGQGLRGLILDLRFNSGGLLDSAVDMTDKFLKKGLIVKTQPGTGIGKLPTYAVAHEKDTHPDYPLVILINSGSASASEIVAGALADQVHKRAILVGERTHGKGSVQGITHYPGGGAQLKYTMAYYYLPSGQRVESQDVTKKQGKKDWGVGPNIEVELTSNELRKMIEVERDNDVLVQPAGGGSDQTGLRPAGRELKKHTIEETLTADPQLAIGVLIVKTKLIQTSALAEGRRD